MEVTMKNTRIYSLLLLCTFGASNIITRAWQFEKRDNRALITHLKSTKMNWFSTDPATRVHLLTKKVAQQEKVLAHTKSMQKKIAREVMWIVGLSAPTVVFSLIAPPTPIRTVLKIGAASWLAGSGIGYGLVTARVHAQSNILTRLNKKLATAQKEVAQLQAQ
jgi:hypothetical protein